MGSWSNAIALSPSLSKERATVFKSPGSYGKIPGFLTLELLLMTLWVEMQKTAVPSLPLFCETVWSSRSGSFSDRRSISGLMSLRTEKDADSGGHRVRERPRFVDAEQEGSCDFRNRRRVVEGREEIPGHPYQGGQCNMIETNMTRSRT